MKHTVLFLLLALAVSSANCLSQETSGRVGDKATIVFFREHHFTGSALKPSVYVDGKEIDRLSNGRWFSVEVEPGKHEVASSAKHEADTVIQAAAGETLFVQMVIVTGTWRGGGRLLQVDPKAAQEKIAKLEPLPGKERVSVPAATKSEAEAEQPKSQVEPERQAAMENGQTQKGTGTVVVSSVPDGAEVYVDRSLVGGVPATLKLASGKHTIRVALNGYKDWSRELSVLASSEVRLTATLEKQN